MMIHNHILFLRRRLRSVWLIAILCASTAFAQGDLSTRFMLAQSYEQAGDYSRAQTILEDLIKIQPDNISFLITLNNNYIAQKKFALSIILLKPRYERNTDDMNMLGLLGRSYYMSGDEHSAFALWDGFIQRKGYDAQVCRTMAMVMIELRNFDKAAEYFLLGKQHAADKTLFGYDLANIYATTMKYRLAGLELLEILQTAPDQFSSVQSRMSAYFARPEALQEFIPVFESAKGINIGIDRILAVLYIENAQFTKAFEIYKAIDERFARGGNEVLDYGLTLHQRGKFSPAVEVFEYLLKQYPNSQVSALAKINYGKALESSVDEAIEQRSPHWKPISALSNENLAEYEKVITAYRDVIHSFSHSDVAIEAFERMGEIYAKTDRSDSARLCFRQIITSYPMSAYFPSALMNQSKLFVQFGQLDSAMMSYDRLLSLPGLPPSTANIVKYHKAKLYFYRSDFEKARDLISDILQTMRDDDANDAIELSLLLNGDINDSTLLVQYANALLLIEQNHFAQADLLLINICNSKEQFYLKSHAEIKRVEMKIALSDYGQALALINAINLEKSNIFEDRSAYYSGLIQQYGLHDKTKALQIYETFLSAYPSSIYCDEVREAIIKVKGNS
jgi:tetratricopeptide (TPR) repeat protein